MKCICTQENLSQGLSLVGHIASKSTNLPILSNILIRAQKGGLTLSATNLEIGITKRVRAKVVEGGAVTIPGRIFSEYVTLLDQDTVTLEQKDANLAVSTERAQTTLRGLPADDFPLIPEIEKKDGYTCAVSDLRNAISQVVFAAAFDDARPEISGVQMSFGEKTLTLAATDSYRLAERTVPLGGGTATPRAAIIPVRALQELQRILQQDGETVEIFLAENQILFGYAETEIISRLIDGQYPNYQQIIPEAHETRFTVDREDFLKAARASSLFSRPGINDLTLSIQTKEGRAVLEAANTQVGENRQTISVKAEGKDNSIVFNSRYILDGLNNLHDDTIVFEMTNNASPGVFKPETGGDYLYIIMPIKQ